MAASNALNLALGTSSPPFRAVPTLYYVLPQDMLCFLLVLSSLLAAQSSSPNLLSEKYLMHQVSFPNPGFCVLEGAKRFSKIQVRIVPREPFPGLQRSYQFFLESVC